MLGKLEALSRVNQSSRFAIYRGVDAKELLELCVERPTISPILRFKMAKKTLSRR